MEVNAWVAISEAKVWSAVFKGGGISDGFRKSNSQGWASKGNSSVALGMVHYAVLGTSRRFASTELWEWEGT